MKIKGNGSSLAAARWSSICLYAYSFFFFFLGPSSYSLGLGPALRYSLRLTGSLSVPSTRCRNAPLQCYAKERFNDFSSSSMPSFSLLQSLIWTDYRLAVVFTVLFPLMLLVWALVSRADIVQQLLIIYWKVSSLLAITVYLMIAELPFSFLVALMARILIPVSLWFWADLNEEIREQPFSLLKLVFTAWRWGVTFYCGLGVLFQIPFLPCAFSRTVFAGERCQVWLEAPQLFRESFHSGFTPGFLGFWAILALVIYVLTLSYFIFVKLGRQGRSALNQ